LYQGPQNSRLQKRAGHLDAATHFTYSALPVKVIQWDFRVTGLLENCMIESTGYGSIDGDGFIDFVETTKGSNNKEDLEKPRFHIFRAFYGKIS
jgi:hypothetical protein